MADKDTRDEQLKATAKRVAEETAEAEARQDTQPTPTQEENDRAKLGVASLKELDDKEPDGSKEVEGSGAGTYTTRAATAKK